MRVLHVMRSNTMSGAGRGTLWLHNALLRCGVDSVLLCDDDVSNLETAIHSFREIFLEREMIRAASFADRMATPPIQAEYTFSLGRFGSGIKRAIKRFSPDILHLHWINGGLLGVLDLKDIPTPIIWTFRDMWPFTGGCHYTLGCQRFSVGCGKCAALGSQRAEDKSRDMLNMKRRTYRGLDLYGVCISNWLIDKANRSGIFAPGKLTVISNIYDPGKFYPVSKLAARSVLGLPPDATIVGTGATNHSDAYKGLDLFWAAWEAASIKNGLVVTFGANSQANERGHRDFGVISDDERLRLLYSACDLFVMPSRQEAFGKTALEAMACGTPAIAFREGGGADIIADRETGYLVNNITSEDLAASLVAFEALSANERDGMSEAAAAKAVERFSPETAARAYHDHYLRALK